MQIFFIVIIAIYSLVVLLKFGYNMWDMLTLDAKRYSFIQLKKFASTRTMFSVDHNEYASIYIHALLKYFGIRVVIVSVLVWLVIRFV